MNRNDDDEENVVPKSSTRQVQSARPSERSVEPEQANVEVEDRLTLQRPSTTGATPYIKQPLTPVRLESNRLPRPLTPGRRGSADLKHKVLEDRGIGMDSDSTAIQSDAETAATKGSKGSAPR